MWSMDAFLKILKWIKWYKKMPIKNQWFWFWFEFWGKNPMKDSNEASDLQMCKVQWQSQTTILDWIKV